MKKKLPEQQAKMLSQKGYYYDTTEYGRQKIIPYSDGQGFKQSFIVL